MHLERFYWARILKNRLKLVYENSMSEALRMRARHGDGVACLPESLVKPDIDNNLLTTVDAGAVPVDLACILHQHLRIWVILAKQVE